MLKFTEQGISCPSCGHDRFEIGKQCSCGYQYDTSYSMDPEKKQGNTGSGKQQKTVAPVQTNEQSSEIIVKEIDAWTASYSPEEKCISLGTPALQSFRLKLGIRDLEELLEYMYHHTGQEKTIRKLSLSDTEIRELMESVHSLIEEKRAKVKIHFSDDDLLRTAAFVNLKLKT